MRKNNFTDTSIIALAIILLISSVIAINITGAYYANEIVVIDTIENDSEKEYIYPEDMYTYNTEGEIIRIEAPTMFSPFIEETEDTDIDDYIESEIIEESIIIENFEIIEETIETEEVINKDNYTKYTVKAGDNYYDISTKFYKNAVYFKALEEYNNKTMIHPGDVLIIPPIEDEEFQNLYNNINKEFKVSLDNFVNSTKGTVIKAGTNEEYKYGKRMNPAVDITIPSTDNMKNYTEEVDTSNYTLVGSWFITGYTPGCEHCCGSTEGITASGVKAICGYTVATGKSLPFGTTIYVEGYGYYVVEDRGPRDGIIDIASPNHEACGPVTKRGVNVYIVPNE